MTIAARKNNHIEICLRKDVRSKLTNGFERYRLIHNALPEQDFGSFKIETEFLGKTVSAPFLISSMTGGTDYGEKINRNLLEAAGTLNLPFAIGSQRIYLSDPKLKALPVRKIAGNIPILANIGAVQLNYGYDRDFCLRAVEMIEADALILHLNPLQELIQNSGNTDFSELLPKIRALCRDFPVPVAVKEVGWGISETTAEKLVDAGISIIDAAGAGGTSWSKVESLVNGGNYSAKLAEPFAYWGIPTAECIEKIHKKFPDICLIASGGITNGVDAAKARFLGADLCGTAAVLLPAAAEGTADNVCEELRCLIEQYKIAMFLSSSIERV